MQSRERSDRRQARDRGAAVRARRTVPDPLGDAPAAAVALDPPAQPDAIARAVLRDAFGGSAQMDVAIGRGGARIRRRRGDEQVGLARVIDMAQRLGISQSRYSEIEATPERITLERLISIAAILGLEVVLQDKPPSAPTSEW